MFAVSKRYNKFFIGIYLMVRRDILSDDSRGSYPSAVVAFRGIKSSDGIQYII